MPGLVADYPGLDVHGVVADFERHLDRLPDRRPAGWSPSSAAPSATSTPAQRAAFLAALGAHARARRRAAARHRPGQGPRPAGPRVRRRGRRHRRVQPQRAARDQPRARRRLRRRRASSTSRCGTPSTSGSRCGCGRSTRRRSTYPRLDLDVDFAAGEEMRTEISAKFRRETGRRRARRRRAAARAVVDRRAPATSRSPSRWPDGRLVAGGAACDARPGRRRHRMRVWSASTWGVGHVFPMVPLARAFVAAGHDVLWVTNEPTCALVRAAGIEPRRAGWTGRPRRGAGVVSPRQPRPCRVRPAAGFAFPAHVRRLGDPGDGGRPARDGSARGGRTCSCTTGRARLRWSAPCSGSGSVTHSWGGAVPPELADGGRGPGRAAVGGARSRRRAVRRSFVLDLPRPVPALGAAGAARPRPRRAGAAAGPLQR